MAKWRILLIRTYAEEENCEAIFRRSGSEFIILRMHLSYDRKRDGFRTKSAFLVVENLVENLKISFRD
jgi:hypothetical protein